MTDTTTNAAADKVERKAKHELLAADKSVVTDITTAVGIRYTDLSGTTQPFEYLIPDAKAGTPLTMLALFGAKTKATNEASRVRNGKNGGVSNPIEEMEALDEVFESITNGVWRDKAEGGGGSRTDKDLLATVVLELLGSSAKGDKAHYVKRFTDDLPYLRKVLASDAGEEYKRRAGKSRVAIADLA